jgi:predicted DNA-binding transcriptional regulator AlpA
MNVKLLEFALEGLRKEVEHLKAEVKELKSELDKKEDVLPNQITPTSSEDELLDTKEVLKKLGICYNTLQSIIRDGLITPLKISKRRIRFSKNGIQKYILSLNS